MLAFTMSPVFMMSVSGRLFCMTISAPTFFLLMFTQAITMGMMVARLWRQSAFSSLSRQRMNCSSLRARSWVPSE